MDDQFNGRTDDDLFADDFEPVIAEQPAPSESLTAQKVQEAPSLPVAATKSPIETPSQTQSQVTATESTASTPPSAPPSAPRSLAQSRHNKPAPPPRSPRQPSAPSSSNDTAPPPTPQAPPNATTGEAATAAAPSEKYDPTTRLRSGANPRTKPTDAELAAKMEKMRILSAEKTRRFEQAQRDESDHAIAYARGMEEARKRRAAEEERRRRGEEDRRRMEDERAANRERKLRAMGQKEGGWDEGKEERLAEEDRRGFRGANGGVRGVRRAGGGGGGLAGSRYATAPDEPDSSGGRDFGGERGNRGRGRGRGGPIRGGRGGRGGFQDEHAQNGAAGRPKPDPPAMSKDDFPALPPADNTKTEDAVGATAKLPPAILNPISPLSPGIGGWDEEMAAIDAKNRKL